jgi:hypothetical protein
MSVGAQKVVSETTACRWSSAHSGMHCPSCCARNNAQCSSRRGCSAERVGRIRVQLCIHVLSINRGGFCPITGSRWPSPSQRSERHLLTQLNASRVQYCVLSYLHIAVIIQELHVDIVLHHTVCSARLAVHHSGHCAPSWSLFLASVSLLSVERPE